MRDIFVDGESPLKQLHPIDPDDVVADEWKSAIIDTNRNSKIYKTIMTWIGLEMAIQICSFQNRMLTWC